MGFTNCTVDNRPSDPRFDWGITSHIERKKKNVTKKKWKIAQEEPQRRDPSPSDIWYSYSPHLAQSHNRELLAWFSKSSLTLSLSSRACQVKSASDYRWCVYWAASRLLAGEECVWLLLGLGWRLGCLFEDERGAPGCPLWPVWELQPPRWRWPHHHPR